MVDQNKKERPAGSYQKTDGFCVYNTEAQRVDQVAHTLGCTVEHIYHLIQEGAFLNVRDISLDSASRSCYRIPRSDVLEFLKIRKEGA